MSQSSLSNVFQSLANLIIFVKVEQNTLLNLETGYKVTYHPARARFLLSPAEEEKIVINFGVEHDPEAKANVLPKLLTLKPATAEQYLQVMKAKSVQMANGGATIVKQEAAPIAPLVSTSSQQIQLLEQISTLEEKVRQLTLSLSLTESGNANPSGMLESLQKLSEFGVIALCHKGYDYEELSNLLGDTDPHGLHGIVNTIIWNLQNAPISHDAKQELQEAIDLELKTW